MKTISMKFAASTCFKILLLADILQLIQVIDFMAHYVNSKEKNSQFSLYLSLFILIAYVIVTLLIKLGKNQTDSNIQIILYFLYMMQQVQFAVRYQPMTKPKEMDSYLNASGLQLLTFVCLVMTPNFPFAQFIFPVTTIYSVGYWGMFVKGKQSDILLQEALLKFVTYALVSVFVAYAHQG